MVASFCFVLVSAPEKSVILFSMVSYQPLSSNLVHLLLIYRDADANDFDRWCWYCRSSFFFLNRAVGPPWSRHLGFALSSLASNVGWCSSHEPLSLSRPVWVWAVTSSTASPAIVPTWIDTLFSVRALSKEDWLRSASVRIKSIHNFRVAEANTYFEAGTLCNFKRIHFAPWFGWIIAIHNS
jgi:hypothetical protein